MKAMTGCAIGGRRLRSVCLSNPTDPQVINNRIQLLTQAQSKYANNDTISQAISATINALSNGQQVDMRQLFAADAVSAAVEAAEATVAINNSKPLSESLKFPASREQD